MLTEAMKSHLTEEVEQIRAADLYKEERVITTPQQSRIGIVGGHEVVNMCANN